MDDYGVNVAPSLIVGAAIPMKLFGVNSSGNLNIDFSADLYGRSNELPDFNDGVYNHKEIEGDILIIPLVVNTTYDFKDKATDNFYPFAGFGTGYYMGYEYIDQRIVTSTGSYPQTISDGGKNYFFGGLGFQALAGVRYGYFFTAVKYAVVSNNSEPDFRMQTDKTLGGITFILGMRY